jgi:hypothetical protein
MDKDKLVDGPFGSNACYERTIVDGNTNDTVTTWLCFGSGYTSSTLMEKDSPAVKNAIESSPELYRDLMHEDENKRVWLPATITLPGKGMVFIDGTSKDNWSWTAVDSIDITEEDRKVGNYPENQTVRMDMKKKRIYAKTDFMDALESIGFFNMPLE